jgi:plastocyanin
MKIFLLSCFILLFCASENISAGDIQGKITAKGRKNNAGAVIYISKIEGKTFAPPKEHAKIDQKNLVFNPHILPVVKGTTVDFHNSDDVLHNVFSPDNCAEKFNLGTWPKGQSKSYTFKNPGCISVMLCNVHPEMEAYVLVLETPYYAVSEKDGSYKIENVPAGKYTLKCWHEKLKETSVEITVSASGAVSQDFELKK